MRAERLRENGSCERFNGKLRDELRNSGIFYTLKEAQIMIEAWRRHYNTIRPQLSIGYQPPALEALIWSATKPMAPMQPLNEQSNRITQRGPVSVIDG